MGITSIKNDENIRIKNIKIVSEFAIFMSVLSAAEVKNLSVNKITCDKKMK